MTATALDGAIQHAGEERSNDVRRIAASSEPSCLRTYTPSLAVIAKSAGCWHWTLDGRKLMDFTSGVLVANLGHNPTRWWQRVQRYMGWPALDAATGEEFTAAVPLTTYNAVTPLEAQASQRLAALMRAQPGGSRCEQVMWAASGSEAVHKALVTAMAQRPGANIVLATRRGFHGKKGLAAAVTGDEHSPDRDPRVKFISFPTEECVDVAARRESLDLAAYERELQAQWEAYGSSICALITEPYLGGGGSFHPQKEYLQLLERFCREHDVLFILDEVQANFGRTGSLFAFSEYGVEPDMVVLGKGLGNGIAVSAVVGRADVFARLNFGDGSDTWSGNPLASASVLATLDEFESGDVLAHARRLGALLEKHLLKLQAEVPAIARVRGEALVWGLECAPLDGRTAAETAETLVKSCYLGDEEGRAIHLLGPLSGKVVRVSPPLTTPLAAAEEYLAVLHERAANLSRSFG
ncbi:MAG TPA: aspartate aminotransferase family protein [Pirellulales bacterium]